MRAALYGLLLVASTVAVEMTTEVESAAELGASAKRGPPMLKAQDIDGLKVVDEYKRFTGTLTQEEMGLRTKLASPPETSKVGYTAVAGYKYTYMSRTIEDKSRSECELVCSTYSACQSYSYNKETRTCIWSMSRIKYDPDYTMWAKQLDASGSHHTHEYMEMPGMRVQERDGDVQGDISYEECKYQCSKDESCKTFSFNKEKATCVKTGIPIHFATAWVYSEKDIPTTGEKKIDHKKENKLKKKLKKEWLTKSSTADDRADMEATMKVTAHLKNAQEAATHAEMVEKVARRDSFFASQKCVMLQGMAASSVKRAMDIQNIMGKTQLRAVKKEAESERLGKLTKTQVTKESLQKAVMNDKIGKLYMEEAWQKYTKIKPLEIDEKKNTHVMKEHKQKACHKKIAKVELFERKEARMKATESTAKDWVLRKRLSAAQMTYKKAAQESAVQDTKERAVKKKVEFQREQVEASEKASTKATEETSQKMAMDKKERYMNKLGYTQKDSKKAKKRAMFAKEKLFKATGFKNDLKKTLKENQKKYHTRKKEQKEKKLAEHAKKEAEASKRRHAAEKKQKAKETETELAAKRTQQQQMLAEQKFAKMAADKDKEANDAILADNKHNALLDAEGKEKKDEEQRNKELAKAVEKERDEKRKTAEDELRSKNLLKQLHDSQVEAAKAAAGDAAAARQAATAQEQSKEVAKKMKSGGGDDAALVAKEKHNKENELNSSEAAEKASAKKAQTAESQADAAKSLKAGSCLFICQEGKHVKDQAKKMEIAEKMQEKIKNGSPEVELIQLSESLSEKAECSDFQAPLGPGDCGSPITATITQMICGAVADDCKEHCFNTATPVEARESSCKSSLPDEAAALVDSTQKAAKSAPPLSDQERNLSKVKESETKETKQKIELAKPVPFKLVEKTHEPFTYKGCEC